MRRRLVFICKYAVNARPSRGNLKQVFSFLSGGRVSSVSWEAFWFYSCRTCWQQKPQDLCRIDGSSCLWKSMDDLQWSLCNSISSALLRNKKLRDYFQRENILYLELPFPFSCAITLPWEHIGLALLDKRPNYPCCTTSLQSVFHHTFYSHSCIP